MPQTKIKTQTVTNTHLALAVSAAFLAGSLAFAAAPAVQGGGPGNVPGACVLSEATIVYTHAINKTRQLCPNNGYWGARFTCTDRRNDTVSVGVGNPCVTQEQILAMARAKCADQTHMCAPRVAAPATSVSMSIDTTYGNLQNDQYALAGMQKFMAGRIKMAAVGENMRFRDLALQFIPNSARTSMNDLSNSIASVSLYSDPTLADASLLGTSPFSPTTTVLQDIDFVVQNGMNAYVYIGLNFNSVSTEFDGTAIPSSSFKIGLANTGNRVTGLASANDIVPITGAAHTNDITLVPVKITNVASSFPGGTLVGGNQILGTFQVTALAGRNTNEFGEPLAARLTQLGLQLISDVGTNLNQNISNLQLCREESRNCIDLTNSWMGALSATNTTITLVNAVNGTSTINMSAFPDLDDQKVDSGATVEYEIRGTVNNPVDHFVQLRVVNLNNKGLTYTVDTNDDGIDDYFFYDIRKDVPRGVDYPNVIVRPLN